MQFKEDIAGVLVEDGGGPEESWPEGEKQEAKKEFSRFALAVGVSAVMFPSEIKWGTLWRFVERE